MIGVVAAGWSFAAINAVAFGSGNVAPVGEESAGSNVSSASADASSVIGTVIVLAVSPGANATVPLVAVKSAAPAVPLAVV